LSILVREYRVTNHGEIESRTHVFRPDFRQEFGDILGLIPQQRMDQILEGNGEIEVPPFVTNQFDFHKTAYQQIQIVFGYAPNKHLRSNVVNVVFRKGAGLTIGSPIEKILRKRDLLDLHYIVHELQTDSEDLPERVETLLSEIDAVNSDFWEEEKYGAYLWIKKLRDGFWESREQTQSAFKATRKISVTPGNPKIIFETDELQGTTLRDRVRVSLRENKRSRPILFKYDEVIKQLREEILR